MNLANNKEWLEQRNTGVQKVLKKIFRGSSPTLDFEKFLYEIFLSG
jgi:hypothetical protein